MSNVDVIPDDVRALLLEHIESYEQLEVLLLLNEQSDRDWSVEALAKALRATPDTVGEAVASLTEQGILRRSAGQASGAVVVTDEAKLADSVARLARCYRDHRLEIVQLVTTNAIDRIRNAALRTFADAFILDRKKRDG